MEEWENGLQIFLQANHGGQYWISTLRALSKKHTGGQLLFPSGLPMDNVNSDHHEPAFPWYSNTSKQWMTVGVYWKMNIQRGSNIASTLPLLYRNVGKATIIPFTISFLCHICDGLPICRFKVVSGHRVPGVSLQTTSSMLDPALLTSRVRVSPFNKVTDVQAADTNYRTSNGGTGRFEAKVKTVWWWP